uniref:Uncharacterized protein n=1 Tax=Anguilla anguilla TaxID=7936 RepID=A0A0E9TIP3_ANGAN
MSISVIAGVCRHVILGQSVTCHFLSPNIIV